MFFFSFRRLCAAAPGLDSPISPSTHLSAANIRCDFLSFAQPQILGIHTVMHVFLAACCICSGLVVRSFYHIGAGKTPSPAVMVQSRQRTLHCNQTIMYLSLLKGHWKGAGVPMNRRQLNLLITNRFKVSTNRSVVVAKLGDAMWRRHSQKRRETWVGLSQVSLKSSKSTPGQVKEKQVYDKDKPSIK